MVGCKKNNQSVRILLSNIKYFGFIQMVTNKELNVLYDNRS